MMLRDVLEWAKTASTEELLAANRVICLHARQNKLVNAQKAMCKFHIGQKVKFFHTTKGEWITGIIERLNTKTATIKEPGQLNGWRVNPSILEVA